MKQIPPKGYVMMGNRRLASRYCLVLIVKLIRFLGKQCLENDKIGLILVIYEGLSN